jgi:hypothetical protein
MQASRLILPWRLSSFEAVGAGSANAKLCTSARPVIRILDAHRETLDDASTSAGTVRMGAERLRGMESCTMQTLPSDLLVFLGPTRYALWPV